MFLPPEQRQPGPLPWEPPPPKRELSKREESVVLWVVCFFVVTMLLAPIGGSTILDAVGYLFRR